MLKVISNSKFAPNSRYNPFSPVSVNENLT